MARHQGELTAPPAAGSDAKALELARIWAIDGEQHVVLRHDAWSDPAAWGLMLVDLARHVARALHQVEGLDPNETLLRIREGFDAEWSSPTDEPTG